MNHPWRDLTEEQCRRKADVMAAAFAEVGIKATPHYETGGVFTVTYVGVPDEVAYRASCLGFQAIGEEPTPWPEWVELVGTGRP